MKISLHIPSSITHIDEFHKDLTLLGLHLIVFQVLPIEFIILLYYYFTLSSSCLANHQSQFPQNPRKVMIKLLFQKRLFAFYNNWSLQKQELWGNSDVVVIHSLQQNPRSSQFYIWLVGEELADTTTIFSPDGIYFFSTQENFSKIRSLCSSATLVQKIPVSVQLKQKNDDAFTLIDSTIRKARDIRNKKPLFVDHDRCSPFIVGYVEGEHPKSKLLLTCINDLEPKKYKAATINSGLNMLIGTVNKPIFDEKEGLKSVTVPPVHNMPPKSKRSLLAKCSPSRVNEDPLQTDENVLLLMENLDLSSPSAKLRVPNRYGEQMFNFGANNKADMVFKWDNKLSGTANEGNKNADQVFKFGANRLNSKEDIANAGQVFLFGANRSGGKEDIAKEGNKNGDQEDKSKSDELFKFGVGKRDRDQLFKIGGSLLDAKEDKSKKGNKDADNLLGIDSRPLEISLAGDKYSVKNINLLKERMTAFYSSWRKYKEGGWGEADVLVITNQSVGQVEPLSRSLSSSFLLWLLGHEFPDTTAVFTDTAIEFLCTKESFSRLRTIGIRMTMVAKVPVSVQLKNREFCVDWLKKTLCQVKTVANRCPLVVGYVKGESKEIDALSHSKMFEVANVNTVLTNLLEQEKVGKSELVAAEQLAFQNFFSGTCSGTEAAMEVSFSELAKIKSTDGASYLSHTSEEKKSPSPVELGNVPSIREEKIEVEGDLLRKFEEMKMFPPTKLEQNKKSEQDNSIKDGDVEASNIEKESVVSDDEWTLIEKNCEVEEAVVAEKFTWKRWFMDKTGKSFGVKEKASSKED